MTVLIAALKQRMGELKRLAAQSRIANPVFTIGYGQFVEAAKKRKPKTIMQYWLRRR